MTTSPPLISLNEILQIDATVIAGLLVLLLVTKFLERPHDEQEDDWLAVPRRMVGFITPFFAGSAFLIVMIDLMNIPQLSIDGWARLLTWFGFASLILVLMIITFTPEQRKKRLSKMKKKGLREKIVRYIRKIFSIKTDEEILKDKRKRWKKQMSDRYDKFFKL